MIKIIFIVSFSLIQNILIAQKTNGLYFEKLSGSKWFGERISNDNRDFLKDNFSLSILKQSTDSYVDSNCLWIFDDTRVVVLSKKDTLESFKYKIHKESREIIFSIENDSVVYHYVSSSTGSLIFFSINQNLEITGKASNSKD